MFYLVHVFLHKILKTNYIILVLVSLSLHKNVAPILGNKNRAKSIDRDKLTANKRLPVISSQSDFITVISSQSEGLGKMAQGIVKYF